jgi:two-component system response regulator AtoC
MRAAESEAVLKALESTRWNRKKAAESLRIDYKALLYKMKKLGIGTDQRPARKPAAGDGKRSLHSAAD